jgi:hypothetical protein
MRPGLYCKSFAFPSPGTIASTRPPVSLPGRSEARHARDQSNLLLSQGMAAALRAAELANLASVPLLRPSTPASDGPILFKLARSRAGAAATGERLLPGGGVPGGKTGRRARAPARLLSQSPHSAMPRQDRVSEQPRSAAHRGRPGRGERPRGCACGTPVAIKTRSDRGDSR